MIQKRQNRSIAVINLESPGRRKYRILSDSSEPLERHEINISEPIPIDPPRYSLPIGVVRSHQTFHSKVEVHPPSVKPRSINHQPYHQAYDSSSHSDTAIFDWKRRPVEEKPSPTTHINTAILPAHLALFDPQTLLTRILVAL